MGTPVYAVKRRRPAQPRRGLGGSLILTGTALVALGAVLAFLCSPIFLDACSPLEGAALFVAGLGVTLMIFGAPLVFTRWQFARNLGICTSCGAEIREGNSFCTHCGSRQW